MKRATRLLTVVVMMLACVILTSSTPAPKVTDNVSTTAPVVPPVDGAKNATASPLTYKEMKDIATKMKGSKLTFKEKLGLKLFGKRIATKMSKSMGFHFGGSKSQLTALLLCLFLGDLGIHRFYLGYTWQGIVQLLTLGGCGIWALIDFIRICTGHLQPKDSDYDVTL